MATKSSISLLPLDKASIDALAKEQKIGSRTAKALIVRANDARSAGLNVSPVELKNIKANSPAEASLFAMKSSSSTTKKIWEKVFALRQGILELSFVRDLDGMVVRG